jgi:PIN domain nuclease of toxin-antitoxin system
LNALLDTHVFLWWISDSTNLSKRATSFIRDPRNSVSLSIISAWEILLKARTGRLSIPGDAAQFIETQAEYNGFALLGLRFAHLIGFQRLAMHHRDAFDHLLIAQAQVEGIPLVSGDSQMTKYAIEVIW